MTDIRVNYGTLEQSAAAMKAISAAIDSKLDAMRARLQAMQWDGTDREAYRAHQAQWDAAIADINRILAEIGGAVGIARENYITTEMNNAKVWGG